MRDYAVVCFVCYDKRCVLEPTYNTVISRLHETLKHQGIVSDLAVDDF